MAGKGTGTKLVIVESPAKAKTIGGYLGPGYVVEASIGHIRDLPRNAADVPAQYKGEAWARLGVNTDHEFEPLYVVSPDRKQQVSKLKALVKDADELYLATDEDREGEAIAWHLVQTLNPRIPVRRMVFHEITPQAIAHAIDTPRDIDANLVDAQETRRILDRLYGYEVSPVLWKKVLPRLSAGRVQSVATRIVVERERARMAFHSAEYWDVEATFAPSEPKPNDPETFTATLVSVDDVRIATGRDFDPATGLAPAAVLHLDEGGARGLAARLEGRPFTVKRVEDKPYRRRPYPPFMTSTLQQEAGRKFRWTSATDDAHRAAAVRERLHHLYAYRLDEPVGDGAGRGSAAGPRVVRGRLRSGRAAAVLAQGEERAGGARGDPSRGRLVPHAGRGTQPTQLRRVASVRVDLAAHAGLADGRRGRHDGVGAHGRGVRRRRDRRVLDQRSDDHLPGFPARLRRGPRPGRDRRRRTRRQ